jgi:hypothetical protein
MSARPFIFPHGTTQVLPEIIVELHVWDFYKNLLIYSLSSFDYDRINITDTLSKMYVAPLPASSSPFTGVSR